MWDCSALLCLKQSDYKTAVSLSLILLFVCSERFTRLRRLNCLWQAFDSESQIFHEKHGNGATVHTCPHHQSVTCYNWGQDLFGCYISALCVIFGLCSRSQQPDGSGFARTPKSNIFSPRLESVKKKKIFFFFLSFRPYTQHPKHILQGCSASSDVFGSISSYQFILLLSSPPWHSLLLTGCVGFRLY